VEKMAYRNKVYVCFDADEDIRYYRIMQAWKEHEHIGFTFHNAHDLFQIRVFNEANIKRNLRERMKNTKLLIVLVGQKTRYLYKYVRWEIELALEYDIPIIAVNLNKRNRMDKDFCPPLLRDKPVVHVPFKKDCILYAMKYWGDHYKTAKTKGQIDLFWEHFDNVI
jgi:hypothetical protein